MALKVQTPEPEPFQVPKSPIEYRRTEDFISRYANNTFLQGSGWDLKLIFGELDQTAGPNVVVQHTAITLTWSQVKTLVYFLRLQLAGHEVERGKVNVPKEVVIHLTDTPPKDVNPKAWHAIYALYQELLKDNPELIPESSK